MKTISWTWYGHAGHLCVASSCRFHLCTKVGKYLISTVGDYYIEDARKTIGSGEDDFFETYVFRTLRGSSCTDKACGFRLPEIDLGNIEGIRCATAGEAAKTHMNMCRKYERMKS